MPSLHQSLRLRPVVVWVPGSLSRKERGREQNKVSKFQGDMIRTCYNGQIQICEAARDQPKKHRGSWWKCSPNHFPLTINWITTPFNAQGKRKTVGKKPVAKGLGSAG